MVQLLPASAAPRSPVVPAVPPSGEITTGGPAPLLAEQIQATLGPGEFTTGTYRGTKKGGRRSR